MPVEPVHFSLCQGTGLLKSTGMFVLTSLIECGKVFMQTQNYPKNKQKNKIPSGYYIIE